ncbi:hypothetical protein [Aquimarina longa]|uniref:hypothetical protein n=1 Tax=Aquimarina longa TaxID=1080221 RepID=UPI000781DC10|nr:hypothetical protein [Aquimarina longa]
MNKIICLIFLLLYSSCIDHKQRKNKKNVQTPPLKFEKINNVLFRDPKTLIFYYNEYDVCHKKELYQSKQKLQCIKDQNNICITDIDVNSFIATTTFWVDKKYIFFINDNPTTIQIETIHIDSSITGYYYENSMYRIRKNNLEYFGQKWLSDTVITCKNNPILKNINSDEFKVVYIEEDHDCSINTYGIYKDNFMFHGCWLDLDKISKGLKEKLILAKQNQSFAKKIKI